MKKSNHFFNDENGSLLIIIILILALLTFVGTSTISTSTIERQVASNDYFHKTAFYGADAGSEVGFELLEQNICCASGFTSTGLVNDYETIQIGSVEARASIQGAGEEIAFWKNDYTTVRDGGVPAETNRDIYFPQADGSSPTNLRVGSTTELSEGSAIQMAAGYEGKGKSAGGGGGIRLFMIRSRHQEKMGRGDGIAELIIDWKHLIGQEGPCIY